MNTTRITNRFQGYALADLDCEYCLYWQGKKKGCSIPICCYLVEKQIALENEKNKEG